MTVHFITGFLAFIKFKEVIALVYVGAKGGFNESCENFIFPLCRDIFGSATEHHDTAGYLMLMEASLVLSSCS